MPSPQTWGEGAKSQVFGNKGRHLHLLLFLAVIQSSLTFWRKHQTRTSPQVWGEAQRRSSLDWHNSQCQAILRCALDDGYLLTMLS